MATLAHQLRLGIRHAELAEAHLTEARRLAAGYTEPMTGSEYLALADAQQLAVRTAEAAREAYRPFDPEAGR